MGGGERKYVTRNAVCSASGRTRAHLQQLLDALALAALHELDVDEVVEPRARRRRVPLRSRRPPLSNAERVRGVSVLDLVSGSGTGGGGVGAGVGAVGRGVVGGLGAAAGVGSTAAARHTPGQDWGGSGPAEATSRKRETAKDGEPTALIGGVLRAPCTGARASGLCGSAEAGCTRSRGSGCPSCGWELDVSANFLDPCPAPATVFKTRRDH